MTELSEHEAAIGRHYDEVVLDYELKRLSTECLVEYAITTRYLARLLSAAAVVAEVGVGSGDYTVFLAGRGCSLYLADVSEQLLAATTRRLEDAGLATQIVDARKASATNLGHIPDGACGMVLLLGPLYHLCTLEERTRAVHEAARVLSTDGLILAAGINRLAYLRDTFRQSPRQGAKRQMFHDGFLRDGNLDPDHAPPIGFAHLTTAMELRALMATAFEESTLVGVESFTNLSQETMSNLPPADKDAWLDLVEQTGTTPEGLGASDHFLYIGRKRTRQ
jgi:ubiquinone/menaquinone biosynthesis C-methylase UbiE